MRTTNMSATVDAIPSEILRHVSLEWRIQMYLININVYTLIAFKSLLALSAFLFLLGFSLLLELYRLFLPLHGVLVLEHHRDERLVIALRRQKAEAHQAVRVDGRDVLARGEHCRRLDALSL